MNFRLILAVAVALFASQVDAQQKGAPQQGGSRGEFKTVRERASYSFGMMIGGNLKKQGVDIDVDLLVQGLMEANSGTKLMLTEEQAAAAIQAFEKEVAAKQSQESTDFLVANKKKPGVKTTASGLQYKVVKAGKGPRPKETDAVTVTYRGTFINGNEFDSSAGKPFTIGVGDVILGWKEALQLMEVGSKWQLYIPAELAYGEQGQPPIGPNTTLVFELELLQIAKPPAAGTGAVKGRPQLQ
jgi:FKBP-type peptidyl-prolyl cis-trans isomerase